MDAISVLRNNLKQGHDILEQAMDGLTPEQLHHQFENATIETIATIYAHTVMSEDYLVNGTVLDQSPLFEREGWAEKVGVGMIPFGGDYPRWMAALRDADFPALRAYAEQVYAESDATIAGLTEIDLDRMVNFVDDRSLGNFLGTVIDWHAIHHGGEICALKGALGGKGLPF